MKSRHAGREGEGVFFKREAAFVNDKLPAENAPQKEREKKKRRIYEQHARGKRGKK